MTQSEINRISESNNPEEDTPIWRYMDLAKFVSMLENQGLWFTKASELKDNPYEGFCIAQPIAIPKTESNPQLYRFKDSKGKTHSIPVEKALAALRERSAKICGNAREYLYVNSWCYGSESMAMWQIYGAPGSGMAIRSTVNYGDRLHDSRILCPVKT
jgi:hypothetical protein